MILFQFKTSLFNTTWKIRHKTREMYIKKQNTITADIITVTFQKFISIPTLILTITLNNHKFTIFDCWCVTCTENPEEEDKHKDISPTKTEIRGQSNYYCDPYKTETKNNHN